MDNGPTIFLGLSIVNSSDHFGFFCFCFVLLFRATSAAYGSSQSMYANGY